MVSLRWDLGIVSREVGTTMTELFSILACLRKMELQGEGLIKNKYLSSGASLGWTFSVILFSIISDRRDMGEWICVISLYEVDIVIVTKLRPTFP